MASISLAYRVGRSTVSGIIRETCKAIWNQLQPLYMKPPELDDFQVIAKEFQDLWQFPNCIGAVDGKHCEIQCPPNSGSDFFNFHEFFSIVLLAVVDARYRFIYIDVGAKGKENDSTVFSRSGFGKALNHGRLPIPLPKALPYSDTEVPHVFVGDEAFLLKENFMRTFPRYGGLSYEQKVFNYRLSRARRIVENAFGILTARFRILRGRLQASVTTVDEIVKAVCVLNNYLITSDLSRRYVCQRTIDREVNGCIIQGTWRNTPTLPSVGRLSSNNATASAISIRDKFKDYFVGNGELSWQRTSVENGLF